MSGVRRYFSIAKKVQDGCENIERVVDVWARRLAHTINEADIKAAKGRVVT